MPDESGNYNVECVSPVIEGDPMLNRRFSPYVIGGCIIALLSVTFLGYRAYRKHVEFQAFMSKAETFNRSLAGQSVHSSEAAPEISTGQSESALARQSGGFESEHKASAPAGAGKYVYKIAGFSIQTEEEMSQSDLEVEEWFITGKKTPAVEAYLKTHQKEVRLDRHQIMQRVIGPDGNMYKVIVPIGQEYNEGDAILRSELELPVHLMAEPRGTEGETIHDRLALLEPRMIPPPLSDKPPVKVSFLPNDGEGAVPGWMQKMLRNSMAGLPPGALEGAGLPPSVLGGSESVSAAGYSGGSNFSEGVLNTDTASEAPVSPSDLPDMVKPTPSRRMETGGDVTHQTPPSASAIMGEGISLDSYDTAKQLFDRYGPEEGLSRLREMDPYAAERFERERRDAPSRDVPSDGDYSDDQPPDDAP